MVVVRACVPGHRGKSGDQVDGGILQTLGLVARLRIFLLCVPTHDAFSH